MTRRCMWLLAAAVYHLAATAALESPGKPSRLWQSSAGAQWNDCFLIGNGRLGASVPGGVQNDSIWLNEDTFWNGRYKSRINPKALETLPVIRSHILEGRYGTAQDLAASNYDGVPNSARNYNTLGSMDLVMSHGPAAPGSYERWLDINDASAGVSYTAGGVNFTREYIVSHPADLVAIRITAGKPGALSFSISFRRLLAVSAPSGSDTVVMTGDSGTDLPIDYAVGARVVATGGAVSTSGSNVTCTGADEALIFVTAWTSVRQASPSAKVLSDLKAAKGPFQALREEHTKDYQSLYKRAEFSFGSSTPAQRAMTTAERVGAMSKTYDPEFAELFLQFARYLLISSSRRGLLPANLQGIWNSEVKPMWGSRFTININLQMNYWHAFVTNLIDDVYEPYFDLVRKVNINGKETAKKMFNASGSCAHHNTDLWGDTAPQDNWQPATTWTQGLAWLVTHTYDHYLYTGDVEFLRANFEPMRDSLTFFLDFLTDYKGWKVTNPTTSPENTFIVNNNGGRYAVTVGATIDNILIRTLIHMVLETQEVLGIKDAPFNAQITALLPKLPPLRQNQWGGIMEWIEDWGEAEPGMSHVSQLIGAYPLADITSANATTFAWAQASLKRRLDNSQGGIAGWPLAWNMALAARFFQADKVAHGVTVQLQDACRNTSLMNVGAPAQFQIDANFGSAAGMAEALLQSHEWLLPGTGTGTGGGGGGGGGAFRAASYGDAGRVVLIRLLPALPAAWAVNGGGYARGLRARGGFQVDLAWDSAGRLTGANLTSLAGSPVHVTVGSTVVGKEGPALKVAGGASGTIVSLSGAKGTKFTIGRA